ncbi:vWA domain-containing protein [Vibrio parahaemolyticus]|uniref:vWA domain-containing protein n=1 Tax=Vibrio parahaemolyticus TaxID=670 RepID=UPI0011200C4B|nr:VWA domain-containing protein [Vibrio parahaemolyticus]MBE3841297.1 VWA domain-containing protein [Vibrio parahaemolyticus]MBE3943106.1 VWA domain-containing protein [Vibrio parahaemolyticus]MBE4116793.1 VWA domain-containing protein [Vibrio parahaemolyticus]MBE4776528.1 VWA domain-containing protein [Vibrio parahaemolyticus]MEA5286537.1 VWA domain-containing protein [Vibrio parahaemolyticus]
MNDLLASLTGLSGFEFAHPMWFLILPLPLVVYYLVPAYRTKQMAIKVPFFSQLVEAIGETPSEGASQLTPSWWQRATLILSWLLVVCAMAKPTVLGEPQVRESLGRDVMVVVDLSGSMAEPDFTSRTGEKISRLDAAKEVLTEFVQSRKGDRLGLVLFGDAAFVQTPFTADQKVWLELLSQTDVAMAGQSTHLGDAIGLAIKVLEQSDKSRGALEQDQNREKVAIVLTDGNDTGSFVEPIDAAKVAKAKGVRVHVIAMGDPETIGETALDMDTIHRIAKESGGEAFEALNRDELSAAYDEIGKLEPQLYESTTYRPKQSLHHYLMALVVIMHLLAFSVATLKRRAATRSSLGESDV